MSIGAFYLQHDILSLLQFLHMYHLNFQSVIALVEVMHPNIVQREDKQDSQTRDRPETND